MAIKKGQFTDEKTGDVLYPQTSSDMVENLKENYVSKAGDSLTGNLTFSNNKGIQGTKKAGTKLDILGVDSSDQVYVGDSSSLNSLALKSSTQPKWGDRTLATTNDLLGDLTPKSLTTPYAGLVFKDSSEKTCVFSATKIDVVASSVIYKINLVPGDYEFHFKNVVKKNTVDNSGFSMVVGTGVHRVFIGGNDFTFSLSVFTDINTIEIRKQVEPVGDSRVDSMGEFSIGEFEILHQVVRPKILFYAGDDFGVYDDGKTKLKGFVNKNVPTWQSDYGAAVKSLALKEDIPNKASIVDMIYPVGSIYMSISSANPSTLFGGTWVSWGNGRVPVGVDSSDNDFKTVEKVAGEKEHTLSVEEMPNHNHTTAYIQTANVLKGAGTTVPALVNADATYGGLTGSSGNNKAHNNMQPYITCYMWKRTI